MGPLLMFDKSFIEMLNPDEVSELSVWFNLVSTPVLVAEIIGDLKKTPGKRGLPEDLVRALASKMAHTHALQPASWKKLAWSNLCTADVPMFGQVPVDTDAPNVFVTPDGKGLLYDGIYEQRIWDKWARGDFTVEDEASAAAWRAGRESIDLHALGSDWREFVEKVLGRPKTLEELVTRIDDFLDSFDRKKQTKVLSTTLAVVDAPPSVAAFAMLLFVSGLMPRVKDIAPYATSVTRLYMTFAGAVARGFIGPRKSHIIDLQYLFYAPFSMVFVSGDKLHGELWRAVSGVNTFVWGTDLKADLAKRVAQRGRDTDEDEPDSLIDLLQDRYMRVRIGRRRKKSDAQGDKPQSEKPKTIDDLEPEIRDQFRAATKYFDEMRKRY